jgi:uncharacterized lipoprotein YmbA
MRPTGLLAMVCLATAALAAGCASQPPFRFYTLKAVGTPAAAPSTLVVALGPISVPAVVDRPEIVVSTATNEVSLDDFHRWASPLPDNLAAVMAEDLVLMLGTPRVVRFPQPLAIDPDYRVVVDFRTFESALGAAASLDATWTIHRTKDQRTRTGTTSAREGLTDASFQALAAGHSRAVAKVSRDIADAIAAMQREAP